MVDIIMASGVRIPYMAWVICVSVAVVAAALRIESIERKMQRPSRNAHLQKSICLNLRSSTYHHGFVPTSVSI